jgi:ectoine hydroxylase-related dioxygenase (phytanoyl-CoA dioxygenase family)
VKDGVAYARAPAEALERVVALRVHLDASLPTNGPLRVLPRTHQLGVLSDDQVSKLAESTLAKECIVDRGGVLAMRPLLVHSSARLRTREPRRILHFEYADSLRLEPGIELATA